MRILSALVPALLFLSPLPPATQPRDLDKVLEEADQSAAKGDWKGARKTLLAAIQPEASRDAVLARFFEISRRLSDWAFREKHPELGPEQIFSGKVLRYRDRNRQLKIRYDWADLERRDREMDFLESRDAWFFRVPFDDGAASVEVEGVWPEDANELTPLTIFLGYEPEARAGWELTPGFRLASGTPARMIPRRLGRVGEPSEIFVREVSELDEPEGDFRYTIDQKRGKFYLKRGTKRVGDWETRYPDRLAGHAGFSGRGIRSVELEGQLDEAAWEAFREQGVARMQERFRQVSYDPQADWPDWMSKMAALAESEVGFPPPPQASEAARESWPELMDPRSHLEFETWREEAGVAGAELHYAAAANAAREAAWKRCGDAAELAFNAALEPAAVAVLQARAAYMTGGRREALEDLGEAMKQWPEAAGHERAVLSGRLFGARERLKALDAAIRRGALAERTRSNRQRLAALLEGPDWGQPSEYGGVSIVVRSASPQDTVQQVGETAAAFIQQMIKQMAPMQPPREPMLVYHFNEAEDCSYFCKQAGLPMDSVGYLPEYRLSLWVSENLDPIATDSRLQGMLAEHFLDSSMDIRIAPQWLVAGYREFFANSTARNFRFTVHSSPEAMQALAGNRRGAYIQPNQLVPMSTAEWFDPRHTDVGPEEHRRLLRAESWLLVHFLRTTRDERYTGRIDKYLDALLKGMDRRECFRTAFGDLDPEQFGEDLFQHRQVQLRAARGGR